MEVSQQNNVSLACQVLFIYLFINFLISYSLHSILLILEIELVVQINSGSQSDHMHCSSNFPNDSEVGANESHVTERAMEISQTIIEASEVVRHSAIEISGSDFFASGFRKLCAGVGDALVDPVNDEPPPPGFEDHHDTPLQPNECKFRPSRSDESVPKIGAYVAMAMCRQRLHDDVLKECASLFVYGPLHQFVRLRRSWKNKVFIYY